MKRTFESVEKQHLFSNIQNGLALIQNQITKKKTKLINVTGEPGMGKTFLLSLIPNSIMVGVDQDLRDINTTKVLVFDDANDFDEKSLSAFINQTFSTCVLVIKDPVQGVKKPIVNVQMKAASKEEMYKYFIEHYPTKLVNKVFRNYTSVRQVFQNIKFWGLDQFKDTTEIHIPDKVWSNEGIVGEIITKGLATNVDISPVKHLLFSNTQYSTCQSSLDQIACGLDLMCVADTMDFISDSIADELYKGGYHMIRNKVKVSKLETYLKPRTTQVFKDK